jgi:hypothetical protein
MRTALASMLATMLSVLGTFGPSLAANLKNQVTVEVQSVGLQPGMDVCAAGHLHIKGAVRNQASEPLGRITVAAKAFGEDGTALGTATASTTTPVLAGQRAEIDLELLTVRGPLIKQVKKHGLLSSPPFRA